MRSTSKPIFGKSWGITELFAKYCQQLSNQSKGRHDPNLSCILRRSTKMRSGIPVKITHDPTKKEFILTTIMRRMKGKWARSCKISDECYIFWTFLLLVLDVQASPNPDVVHCLYLYIRLQHRACSLLYDDKD